MLSYTNNKLKKIVSIYFCNTTASTKTISMYDSNPGTNRYYLKDVDIPAKSTLVAVTKDAPIHFEDVTHNLTAIANATGVDFSINWEDTSATTRQIPHHLLLVCGASMKSTVGVMKTTGLKRWLSLTTH